MGGVNSIKSNSIEEIASQYEAMVIDLITENPNAEIFVQSVLPIANKNQEGRLTNDNIIRLNEVLKQIAERHGATYIDVYAVYELNGEMNPEYTQDGVHLKDEYKYLWLDILTEYIQ